MSTRYILVAVTIDDDEAQGDEFELVWEDVEEITGGTFDGVVSVTTIEIDCPHPDVVK